MQIDVNDIPQLIVRGAHVAYAQLNPAGEIFDQFLSTLADRGCSDNDTFVSLAATTAFELKKFKGLTAADQQAVQVLAAIGIGICECLDR